MNTIVIAIISLIVTYSSMTWLIKRHNDITIIKRRWFDRKPQPLSGVGGWLSLAFYVFGIVTTNSGQWTNIIAKLLFAWYMWVGAAVIVSIIAIIAEMLYRRINHKGLIQIKI